MSSARRTMWDHKPASAYHPLFYGWWDEIENDFEKLQTIESGSASSCAICVDIIRKSFSRLILWCSRMSRDRNLYIFTHKNEEVLLRADEIPLDQEFRLCMKVLHYMRKHCSDLSRCLHDIPLSQYIKEILPYLVWGGFSATLFYEMIVQLYDMDKQYALSVMESLYQYAQATTHEDVRQYVKSVFDYFRIKRGESGIL